MTSWLETNLPTILGAPAAATALGLLAKGLPVVWGALRRTEEIARLITELDQEKRESAAKDAQISELTRELRDLYKTSSRLQGKYDALCGKDSSPPTS